MRTRDHQSCVRELKVAEGVLPVVSRLVLPYQLDTITTQNNLS